VSRAVRRPRRERRLGPRRGGGNLPARGVLAVFSKPATYPGFADPPKPRTGSSSTWRHRGEDFDSKKEPWPSDESMYLFQFCPYGLSSLKFSSRGSLVSLVRGLVGLKEERGHKLTVRQLDRNRSPPPSLLAPAPPCLSSLFLPLLSRPRMLGMDF